MTNLAKAFTGLALLAFVLAVLTHFTGPIIGTLPEAFSRACTNLALLAIAFVLAFPDRVSTGRTV
jgi:hypothetical protein